MVKQDIESINCTGNNLIVFLTDHNSGTNSETSPLFAMSGDGRDDIYIPMLFLFHHQGDRLLSAIDESNGNLYMMMGYQAKPSGKVINRV